MKAKFLLVSLLSTFSLSTAFAFNDLIIPYDYVLDSEAKGVKLYRNQSSDVFIQITDLRNAYFKNAFEKSGDKDEPEALKRKSLKNHLKDSGNYKTFSGVNGAFFNNRAIFSPTVVSFPFTPGITDWKESENTRTLCVNGTLAKVENSGYGKYDYSRSCSLSITLLNPNVDKSPTSKTGRMYVGLPDLIGKSVQRSNYVIFLVAKKKTQEEMETIARQWNIHSQNLIMGDGSDSAQILRYGDYSGIKTSRDIPHAIITNSR